MKSLKVMNKTNTKNNNKVRSNIEWPESHFTIEDVQSKYPDAVNITLRFRVKKAEEAKEIVLIGKIKPAIGRPRKVYTRANPSKEVLENARNAGVISMESVKTTVAVADVKTTKKPATKATVSDVAATEVTIANQVAP
jgi:hypothetical protein